MYTPVFLGFSNFDKFENDGTRKKRSIPIPRNTIQKPSTQTLFPRIGAFPLANFYQVLLILKKSFPVMHALRYISGTVSGHPATSNLSWRNPNLANQRLTPISAPS
jgi:hypothetical protein